MLINPRYQLGDISESIARHITPKVPAIPSKWSEANMNLQGPTERKKGKLDLDYSPYMRGLLDLVISDDVQDVTLCMASQTGKTLIERLIMAYLLVNDPSNMMLAMPSENNVREFSKTRWQTLFAESPALIDIRPESEHDFSNLVQSYSNGARLRFAGGGSSANLASEPCKYVFVDEASTFTAKGDEGCPVSQALERTKSYGKLGKRFVVSTPKTETDIVWNRYLEGSRHQYFVKSPFAPDEPAFVLSNDSIKYDKTAGKNADGTYNLSEVERTAYYECPYTGKKIRDAHKPEMLRGGEWRQTNLLNAVTGHLSFHLSSLYAPALTFGDVLIKFLGAKDHINNLRVFINSWLGEPFAQNVHEDNPELLKNREDDYERGDIRHGEIHLAGIDIQKNTLKFVIRSINEAGETRLIEHGERDTWEELDKLCEKHQVFASVVDTGYPARRNEALAAIYKRRHMRWYAIKGAATLQSGTFKQTKELINIGKRGGLFSKTIDHFTIDNSVYSPQIIAARNDLINNWYVYSGVAPSYQKELFAEVAKRKITKTGKEQIYYDCGKNVNDLFDCEKYLDFLFGYFDLTHEFKKWRRYALNSKAKYFYDIPEIEVKQESKPQVEAVEEPKKKKRRRIKQQYGEALY